MDNILSIVIAILAIYLSYQDIRTREISNFGNLIFLGLSIAYARQQRVLWEDIFVYIAVFPFPLVFMYGYLSDFFQKEVLGFGDIKFMMGVGGIMSSSFFWTSIYYFYLIAFCLGAIIGIFYLYYRKQREVPMIPMFSIALFLLKVFYEK